MQNAGIRLIWLVGLALSATQSPAAQLPLQNATATYTQGTRGEWLPANTIDGVREGAFTSWAVSEGESNSSLNESIVWETQWDGSAGDYLFRLHFEETVAAPGHNLGRFRLYYTTDARETFADGVPRGGDVRANWQMIDPLLAVGSGGVRLFPLGDLSVLVTGGSDIRAIYTVIAELPESGVTGFRLEAIEHPALPFNGPGTWPANGNFHLSEFEVYRRE